MMHEKMILKVQKGAYPVPNGYFFITFRHGQHAFCILDRENFHFSVPFSVFSIYLKQPFYPALDIPGLNNFKDLY